MDLGKLKEPFPQDRISWRAQTVSKDGTKALALAYIDARDVMERLDEVCGPENWQCKYTHAGQKTVCDIGINIHAGKAVFRGEGMPYEYLECWVWKADGAGDSDIEAEKGALSDAFKRAAVRWSIGRYLYDLDSPWVPCESREFNGKRQFVKFTDDPWKYVRGVKPAQKVEAPKVDRSAPGQKNESTLTPEQKTVAWLETARTRLKGFTAQAEYKQWKEENKKFLDYIAKNHADKFEAFQVYVDGLWDTWAENF